MPLFFRFNAVNAAFFQFNAVNAAIFAVQRRYRRYFSGSTPLTPLFFKLNAVNAGICPVQCH